MKYKTVAILTLPILISSSVFADSVDNMNALKEAYGKDVVHKKMSSHDIFKKSIKNNTATLDPMEHRTIHNSNKRPMAEIKKKENLTKLTRISEQEALNIVQGVTNEKPLSIQLIHKANYIAYEVITIHSIFTVNAIDGTLMK